MQEVPMAWTDERVALLKKLWNDGLAAAQIARELGGVTANGVIGKVHRLGLSGRAKSPSTKPKKPRKANLGGMLNGLPNRLIQAQLRTEQPLEPLPPTRVDSRFNLEHSGAFEGVDADIAEAFAPYYR